MTDSLTSPDTEGMNMAGLSLTEPDPLVEQHPIQMSPEEANLKAFAYTELTRERAVGEVKNHREAVTAQNMVATGKDADVDSFEEEITAVRQRRISDETVAGVNQALFGTSEAIGTLTQVIKAGTIPVEDELLIRASEAPRDARLLTNENDRSIEFNYIDWVNERQLARDELDAAIAPVSAGMDASFWRLYGDLWSEAVVPFALSSSAGQFAAEVERMQGGDSVDVFMAGVEGFILPGNAREKMREFVLSIPQNERPKIAAQLATSIRDNSGIFGGQGNNVQTLDWIETVISSADAVGPNGFNWDKTLYNLITLIDGIPILGAGGKAALRRVRAGKLWFGELAKINRTKARDVITENLADPRSEAKFTSDSNDLVTGQIPKTQLEAVNSNPAITADDAFRHQLPRQQELVQAADNRAINYTAQEVNAVAERLQSAYQSVKGGWLSINKWVVDVSQGDRVIADAFYTRTKAEGGWLSPRSALNSAIKMTDGDLAGVQVVVRNADGGFDPFLTGKELRKQFGAAKATPDGSEYFIRVKREHFMSQVDQMAFGGNPVFFTAGGLGRWLADATQQFSEQVWKPAYVALGRGEVFQKEALDLVQPFWQLSTGSRRKVVGIIEEGAEKQTTFTPRQLIDNNKDITIGEMKGYYAFRNANDAVWATASRQAYREMQGQGYRTLRSVTDGQHWLARPWRSGDATPIEAYNPRTRRIEPVTASQIETWEKAGGGIEVLHKNDAIVLGKTGKGRQHATNYIIRSGAKGVELDSLPLNVLRYEDGYVSRLSKDNFFVARREDVLKNGLEDTNDVVAVTARTFKEGEEAAARLTLETGIKHEVVDALVDSNYSKVLNDTLLLEQDRIVFGKRTADSLQRADGTPTPMLDPVAAYHRAVAAVGRSVGLEDYVKNQERKFIQTYNKIIPSDKWDEYIANRLGPQAISKDLGQLARGASAEARQAKEALQLWQYYQMLRNTDDPITQRLWRSAINNIAIGVEHLTSSASMGEFVARAQQWDPASLAKGIVFATLIAGNPTRQYALQSAQFSFIMAANPKYAGMAIPDFNLLRVGLGLVDTPNYAAWRKGMASKGRWTEAEVDTILREFKRSGLVAEIDSYAYIGAQIAQKQLGHTATAVGGGFQVLHNAINAPVRAAKKYGFVAGETNNLAMTYSFAMRKYIEETGKNVLSLTPREWQEIGAAASGYALGMHKAGTMAYQQGFISTLTQFWSIQHKAIAAMVPRVAGGSRAFVGSQKAGIAITQIGMYGAAGWGIEEQVRAIFQETGVLDGLDQDTAASVIRVTSTGMLELLLNGILTSITDETVDSSFSSSFSPAGAPLSTLTDFVLSGMQLGLTDGMVQQTAAGSTFGKYKDLFDYINITVNTDTLPNTPDKLTRVIAALPTALSGVSNGLKGFYAMRTGQMMTQYGDHRMQLSWPEAALKAILGVSTNNEEDLRRLQQLDGKMFYFDQSNAQEMAAKVYKAQVKNLLFWESSGVYDMTRTMAGVEGERALLSMLQPHEAELVRDEYIKIAVSKRGSEGDIFKVLMRYTDQNAVTPEKIIRAARQNMLFDKYPEQRENLIYTLERMLEGRDERLEQYEYQNELFNDELSFLLDAED
jgi:hypothetical protein